MNIREINNGKASVLESIPSESLKSEIQVTEKMLHTPFKKIGEKEQMPTDWKEGYVTKIPEKNLSKC